MSDQANTGELGAEAAAEATAAVSSSPAAPEASGLGTITVDGEIVYSTMGTHDKAAQGKGTHGSKGSAAAAQGAAAQGDAATPGAAAQGSASAQDTAAQGAPPWPNSTASAVHSKATQAKPATPPHHHRGSGSLWFGMFLVVVGVLLLFDRVLALSPELRYLFGGFSVWRMWPLLVIMGGIATALTPEHSYEGLTIKRFFDGLSLVALGVVFLGCSFEFVSWSMWLSALSYWPVLLITGGLSILARALKFEWLNLCSSLLFIVVLFAVAAAHWQAPFVLPAPFDALVPLGSLRSNLWFW